MPLLPAGQAHQEGKGRPYNTPPTGCHRPGEKPPCSPALTGTTILVSCLNPRITHSCFHYLQKTRSYSRQALNLARSSENGDNDSSDAQLGQCLWQSCCCCFIEAPPTSSVRRPRPKRIDPAGAHQHRTDPQLTRALIDDGAADYSDVEAPTPNTSAIRPDVKVGFDQAPGLLNNQSDDTVVIQSDEYFLKPSSLMISVMYLLCPTPGGTH